MNGWKHEFRLYKGKPDPLYQNMMMCRDKSWMAVSKGRLTRTELLSACLHDLTPGALISAAGDFLSIELQDWTSHGLYEYKFVEGDFVQKKNRMLELLAEGREVYVGTIHPLLPFSARYNPHIAVETYQEPNHIFVILGLEQNRYVYFDTSSYKSAAFEPYPQNPELGWVSVETVDRVLKQLLQLGYVEWHEERRPYLSQYGWQLLKAYAAEYEAGPEIKWQEPAAVLYRGRQALIRLQAYLCAAQLDLARPSWEFNFIEEGDLLNWKLTDLATRRKLMAEWLKGQDKDELASLWRTSAEDWSRLATFLLYRREKRQYGPHERFGDMIDQILRQEDKICGFLKKYA